MAKLANDPGFAAAVLDALSSHIGVIDANGVIVAVNRAWRAYGLANGADPDRSDVGRHYLAICDAAEDDDSDEAAPWRRACAPCWPGASITSSSNTLAIRRTERAGSWPG